jgi:diguanylate cyclase (GGDEF)-like protein
MSTIPRRLAWFVGSIAGVAIVCLAGSADLILRGSTPILPAAEIATVTSLAFAGIVLRLEIRVDSHRWVLAWGETALVLSLFLVPAPWVVLLTTAGKAAGSAITFHRHQPIKLVYNTAAHAVAAVLAAATAVSIGRGPFDLRDARDVTALLLAGAVYDLASEALTVAVIAVANGSKPGTVWRAGVGLATLTMVGNLAVTAGVLALAALNHRLVLVLPIAALILQKAYREAQRSRVERESSRRLTEAISALGHLDEATILTRTATQAAVLLSASSAEVVIHTAAGEPESVAVYPSARNARLPGPWWTETVELVHPDQDELVGEIRLHFAQPVRLTDRERGLLNALAGVARNALAAARAHSDTEHLAAELSHQVTHDPLTGLPTQQLLLERICAHLDRVRHSDAPAVGMILIDIVELGDVGRTVGPEARNELLRHAADQLRCSTVLGELAARAEDNHFAVFVHEVHDLHDLAMRANSLLAAIATAAPLDAGTISLPATAGIAYARPSTTDPSELLRQAGVALASTGRSHVPVEYYRPADDTASGPNALLVATELREALRSNQLSLHYQPIVSLQNGKPIAAEALVRWSHPSRGLVLPRDFIAVLEEANLLGPYTDWLLHEALLQRASWTDVDPALPVSVNLSARCLFDQELPVRITRAVLDAGLRPHQLMLESPNPRH